MKKCAALAAVLVLCAGTAYAYENSYAGYSVKDGKPFYKLESKKAYAYTEMNSKDIAKEESVQKTAANIVNYYTADDMTQILGADFSTAYFDAEWDKLAVLERSELSLKTVPTPLLDLDKYAAYDHNGNVTIVSQVLKEKVAELVPIIRLQKIGKQKVMTISYLYKQGGEMLINIDTTLLSANDRLYMLTTVSSDHELYSHKKDEKVEDTAIDDEADDNIFADVDVEAREKDTAASIKEAVEKAMQVENVPASSVPQEILQRFAKSHSKLLKGFKPIVPASTPKQLSFTDSVNGKTFDLPEDWFYGQTSIDFEETATVHIAVAGSMTEMEQIAANLSFDNLYAGFATSSDEPGQATKLMDAYWEQMDKSLQYWNSLLVTFSVDNINDGDLKELLATPVSNRLAFESFVDGSLDRLKGFNNEDFTLKNYSTSYDFTREKANIVIDTDFMLLKHYNYNSQIKLGCQQNMAGALLFIQKDAKPVDEALKKQVDSWQF